MAQRCSAHVLPLVLLLFGLVAILLLTVPTENVKEAPGFMYGIVLDAGSSHTSLFIYKWLTDKQNGTGVVTQHGECHVEGDGISSYAGQQEAVGRSLEACLDQAVRDIPTDRHQSTPVYLGATAGMRLLQNSSSEQSRQILKEVGLKIQSYPFSYRGAEILSGKQEGAYGWVTVNYLLENFIKYGFVGHWFSPGRPMVGALDFGGASTQITFATQEHIEDEHDKMELQLYGHKYYLYTHSFLCYGKNQFLKRLMANVVKSQGRQQTVTHPCYPSGYNRTIKMEEIFNSPCTEEHKPSSYNPQMSLTVQGSGHYEHCVGNVSKLFSFGSCQFSRCSFNKVFQPNATGSFMAFSAFFYIHAFLQQVTGITVRTSQQLEEAAKTVCGMTFTQILLRAPGQKSRLQEFCASSVFIKTLILRGYGFDDVSFQHISFQKQAGDTSVGWALGYMLTLSNLLPSESVGIRKSLSTGAWGTLIFLFVVFLLLVLAFVFFRTRDWKKGQDEGTI